MQKLYFDMSQKSLPSAGGKPARVDIRNSLNLKKWKEQVEIICHLSLARV